MSASWWDPLDTSREDAERHPPVDFSTNRPDSATTTTTTTTSSNNSSSSNSNSKNNNRLTTTNAQMRILLEGKFETMSSPGMIGWYCFASVFLGSFLICAAYCYYRNLSSHRRAQRALEDEGQLESIEANVQAWSKAENQRNARVVKACLRRNTKAFVPRYVDSKSKDEDSSNTCGICLEDLVTGQQCVSSSNSTTCRHVFHEGCIVHWFGNRRDWLCPTCRQLFVCHHHAASAAVGMLTPQTSLNSQQLSVTLCPEDFSQDDTRVEGEVEEGMNVEASLAPRETKLTPAPTGAACSNGEDGSMGERDIEMG